MRFHLIMALACGFITAVQAQTTGYVSQTGSHTTPFASWDTAATNIQAAVNAVGSGGLVMVTNGVYRLSATLSLTNGVQLQSTAGWAQTILDRQAGGRCVYMSNAVLDGFTVANGYVGASGVGIYCATGQILNSRITSNRMMTAGLLSGVGLYCSRSLVSNCLIDGNSQVGNTIGSHIDGGGAAVRDGTIVVNCEVRNNSAAYGGGLFMMDDCQVIGSVIASNTAINNGGGGVAVFATSALVSNCVISGNRALLFGGGLVSFTGCTVVDCRFENNGAAMVSTGGSTNYPAGGGLHIGGGLVDRCILRNNTGKEGGGIRLSGGTLRNCLIADNVGIKKDIYGGSVAGACLISAFEPATLENCVFTRNRSEVTEYGGVEIDEYSSAPVTVRNCIVYGNAGVNLSTHAPDLTLSHSCIQDWTELANGMITTDPLFADADGRLATNSPCINTGSNLAWAATGFDLERHPRKLLGQVDMGCAEHFTPMDVTQAAAAGSGAALAMQWVSFSNAGYVVQWAETLDAPDWQTVGPVMVSPADGAMSTNVATAGGAGFYRIVLQQWP